MPLKKTNKQTNKQPIPKIKTLSYLNLLRNCPSYYLQLYPCLDMYYSIPWSVWAIQFSSRRFCPLKDSIPSRRNCRVYFRPGLTYDLNYQFDSVDFSACQQVGLCASVSLQECAFTQSLPECKFTHSLPECKFTQSLPECKFTQSLPEWKYGGVQIYLMSPGEQSYWMCIGEQIYSTLP